MPLSNFIMSNAAERQPEVVDDDFEDPADQGNDDMADSDEQLGMIYGIYVAIAS